MQFVSIKKNIGKHQTNALGLVDGDNVIIISDLDTIGPQDLPELVMNNQLDRIAARAKNAPANSIMKLADLELDVPVSNPGKILCLGLNYKDHINEGPHEAQPYPTIFMRGRTSLVAHGKPIVRPKISEKLDYEAELAVIIGKEAKNLTAANALDCIAGYSCFNDATLRDYQRHTVQWTMGKNFDSTGAFGPFFVTPDELPDGAKGLKIESRVNGQVMQSSNTDLMIFPVVEALVYITEAMTLEAGDIVVMGTPSGVGHARKPPFWMKDGDEVEVSIEGVGTLTNPIKDED